MSRRTRTSRTDLREIARIIWDDASRFVRVRLVVALLLVVATAVMAPLGAVALKLIIDRISVDTQWSIGSVGMLIGLYVASQWLSRCIGELRGVVYARAHRRMLRTVSERLFAHIMHLPMAFHLNRETGAIHQAMNNGLQGYQMVLQHLVFTLLPVLAQLTTVAIVLVSLGQPAFLALLCAAMVCYGVAFTLLTRKLTAAARDASASQVDASAVMLDSILNYETVKFFAAEPVVQQKVGRAFSHTEMAWIGFHRRAGLNGLCLATIFAGFLAVSILHAAQQVRLGRMTIGDFVLVNTYMLQLLAPVEMIGFAIQGLAHGTAMFQKMLELLRERPEPTQPDDELPSQASGELEFEYVCLSYRPDRAVIRDVSFRVPAGRTVAIVGVSGAGKSTLIRLLVRLFEPDTGRILLDGVPTSEISLPALRQAIAVVPQETVLFNDSIGYNIAFGRPGSTREQVEQAARIAHLHDFIMSLPDQYDTKVGERGVKLSGGEKQRVSIARAAIKRPRIYVFDEATSSLDSRTEREILVNLREMSRSSTTLIIAHRLSTVAHADEILVLENGAIVERGDHDALLRGNGRYAALWHAQQAPRKAAEPLPA